MKVWVDGQLVDKADAKLSVFDHGMLYGDGVFEGLRSYGGKVFQFKAHMDRLFASAERIRLTVPFTAQQLVDATCATMAANGIADGYIRMVVTRGEGTLGLGPDKCSKGSAFIIADQIALYPDELYESGMPVIIAKTVRTSARMVDPRVKSLNYLNNILAKIECLDAGVSEAIMLSEDGDVAEGTGDNVFIVEDGEVITPPAEAGLLLGITRAVVLHLCKKLRIPASQRRVTPDDLLAADECFLTGTAAEVISVTSVDGAPIGDGKAGPITRRLLSAFREFIRSGEENAYEA